MQSTRRLFQAIGRIHKPDVVEVPPPIQAYISIRCDWLYRLDVGWLDRVLGRKQAEEGQGPARDLDSETLRQLSAAGADTAKPTEVVSYLYLPDEAKASAAAAELRLAGYAVTVRPAATGENWLALAKIDLVPSSENIALLKSRFEGLAARLGGDFDGWEAAVTS